ncbi:unnamed protein product [Symbiodinium sp. CCMP2592]|nr:unnamed protein product [Symbiodinium sp. CCMP2592]
MGKSGVLKKPSASALVKKPSLKQDPSDDLAPAVPEPLQRLKALSEASEASGETVLPSEEASLYAPDCFLHLWDTLSSEQKEYLRKPSFLFSLIPDWVELCVSSVAPLNTDMVSSAVVSAYVAVCALGKAFLRKQAEILTLLGLFLGLDRADLFFCLASGEQISLIWNGAVSLRWTLNGWLVRRRDLSVGDHLWLCWKNPPQGHALTERDQGDLGFSEEEASDPNGESAAEASGEGSALPALSEKSLGRSFLIVHEDGGGAAAASSAALVSSEDVSEQLVAASEGSGKQKRLLHFWKPEHPLAEKPPLEKEAQPKGRPLSAAMKQILAEVARESVVEQTDEEARLEAQRRYAKKKNTGRPKNLPGAPSKKRSAEMPLAVQARVLKQMKTEMPGFSSEQDFAAGMSRKLGLDKKYVKKLWARRDTVLLQQSERNFSVRPGKHLSGHSGRGRQKASSRLPGQGFRLAGAGRKAEFSAVKTALRNWFEESRAYGHSVKKRHLLSQWQLLLSQELLKLKSAKSASADSFERGRLDQKISEGEKQLQSAAKDSGKNRLRQLMLDVGAKNLQPDLKTKLSESEEMVSAKLTYQSLDRTLWTACFAPLEDLATRVAKPSEFREHVSDLVVICSDQIPLWIKSGSERELFAEWEHNPLPQQHLREALKNHHLSSSDQVKSGDLVAPLLQAVKPSAARQALYGLCKDPALEGESGQSGLSGQVLPGLLVVHGSHARLNNIDSSGRFLRDETFEFSGKVICRKAGSSAGNLLRGWRQARDKDPSLFRQISLMSQPSANVDGIIFAWAQEELAALAPASVHVRDCFAAAWSVSGAESLFYSQSLQTVIGPKLTASLQLTDTDYARSFKSLARSAMDNLHAGQTALLAAGEKEFWRASHLDMATAVVQAQTKMSERQASKDWIVSGLRRKGLLAYRPDFSKQTLVPLKDEDCCGASMGSARTKPAWLKDRYSWLDASGIPAQPDWSAPHGAKVVADLVEWSYHQSDSQDEALESQVSEALLNVHEMPLDLQLPCIESGVLTLSLDLQRAAWHKQLSADQKTLQKKAVKRDVKQMIVLAKRKLRGKLLEAMRHRLTQMSRQQALHRLVPRASDKKASVTKKAALKQKKKTALAHAAKALAKAKALDDKPSGDSALVPGPALADPVSQKASELKEATKGPLYGRVCRILREDHTCGKSGKCSLHNLLTNQVSLVGVGDACATVILSDKEVCEASGGFFAAEPVELLKFKKSYPQMLLDQHLRYGWELLRYNLSDSDENWFLENKICMVDPKLSGQLLGEHDRPELLRAALDRLRSENKLLFVPVWGHSPNHWTLLVLQRAELSENFSVKYLDSLSEKHEECSVNAARLLSLLLPAETLPERSSSGTQKSDECGFCVLANMLWICSGLLLEGPCARGSRGKLVLELMSELKGFLAQLSGEQSKLEKELLAKEKDLEKTLKANRIRSEKLAAKSGKDAASVLKLENLAKQLLSLNKEPDASDLSEEDKSRIETVRLTGLGVCSRCHWQSGCLDCDPAKLERYLLNRLRLELGLPPKAA